MIDLVLQPNKKMSERELPRLIMGGDAFFGFDGRPDMSADKIFSVMKHAYTNGIRAFEFSVQNEVIEAVARMKLLDHDISFFANISWRCGVNLKGIDIIDLKDRALNTIDKFLTPKEKEMLDLLPTEVKAHWFGNNSSKKTFSESDIQQITIDYDSFQSRLEIVKKYAKHCLIGSDFGDWLAMLGRTDLLGKMCNEILANDMIPIAITHWPSLILPRISDLPFGGYSCMLNPNAYLLSYSEICNHTTLINKPIYGFRLLKESNYSPQLIREAIRKAFSIPNLHGAIIGLKSQAEIDVTLPIVFDEVFSAE